MAEAPVVPIETTPRGPARLIFAPPNDMDADNTELSGPIIVAGIRETAFIAQ